MDFNPGFIPLLWVALILIVKLIRTLKKDRLDHKNSVLVKILEGYPDSTFLKADGFDEAIIGVDHGEIRLVYSINKVIDILSNTMNSEEAWEYFEFNIKDSYMGEKTPLWIMTLE